MKMPRRTVLKPAMMSARVMSRKKSMMAEMTVCRKERILDRQLHVGKWGEYLRRRSLTHDAIALIADHVFRRPILTSPGMALIPLQVLMASCFPCFAQYFAPS